MRHLEHAEQAALVKGAVFGRLTLLETCSNQDLKVLCRCSCGSEKRIKGGNIRSGRSRSCGCRVVEASALRMTKHGKSKTPEYQAWGNAKSRCHNKRNPRYPEWGGRGIAVCQEWRDSFESFLAHMGSRPGPGYSLDRIDCNRGYEPGNCRWATAVVQSSNRPTWVNEITFGGLTLNISAWSRRVGIDRKTLCDRISHGWSIEDSLTLPAGAKRAAK